MHSCFECAFFRKYAEEQVYPYETFIGLCLAIPMKVPKRDVSPCGLFKRPEKKREVKVKG